MDPDLTDLVPLFVAETRGRLEKLAGLPLRLDQEAAATAEARRELHSIKGAARMLRLSAVAELCHAAEGALAAPTADSGPLLTRVTDRLAAMVETVEQGQPPKADDALLAALRTGGSQTPPPPAPTPQPAASAGFSSDVRAEAAVLARLADRGTRLRILSAGMAHPVARLADLARLAEAGVREADAATVLAGLSTTLRQTTESLEASRRRLQRLTESHLEELLALQLQPLKGSLHSLARHARELALSLGREVDVEVSGGRTRLDRRITNELEEALIHIVRNAVDHGIEPPATRQDLGKPRKGTLSLRAETLGGRVLLSIHDDGSGIDSAAVLAAATEAGLVDSTAAAALSREDTLRLLFSPSFSTRRSATELSGRGVGLDVVAMAAARAGGEARLESTPGKGTTVVVEVPVARRGETVLLLRAGQARVALPKTLLRWAAPLPGENVVERDGTALARLGQRLVPFLPLASVLGETPGSVQTLLGGVVGGQAVALAVDALESEEEVLIRPMTRLARASHLFEGVALTAAGEPVGVLASNLLTRRDIASTARSPFQPPAARLKVLVVDDSTVTREMIRRLLDDAGFTVDAVVDATTALARLGAARWDCLVTDIEMPAIDGLELTRRVRATANLAQLPVVVLSTRDDPQDVMAGLQAGADAYLTKQSLDAAELVELVRRLGGRR